MSRLSNIIEAFIKELLEESNNRAIEIQRNELADYFHCAPSQINYVLMTRFTVDKGYLIESRRGGGGCIKIVKVNVDKNQYLKILMEEIGDAIGRVKAEGIIRRLVEKKWISEREGRLMAAAVNDRSINIPVNMKDQVRANIFKNMLAAVFIFDGRE
ncbi:CtsR family transcriptional regulator [Thermotalea metallivorans]|uniref:Transcriptional regulator CtsR n=1 Tax=Thermotalea metallivorans TaxID=520762 RepID=A0A140L2P7_9FIRM|nr:CtsR family transcriptional regulator [Thermotalea metallivorans]KXG74822.1 Transcriptional regulator CtsR [Thermotalea metallivorans]